MKIATWTCGLVLSAALMIFLWRDWATSILIPRECSQKEEYEHPRDENCSTYRSVLFPGKRPIILGLGDFLESHGEAVIAFFTVVLAASTIMLWFATKRIGDDANRTAERSAKHFRASERAYVHASHRPPGANFSIWQGSLWMTITLELNNAGRSPATISDFVICYEVLGTHIQPPDIPTYGNNFVRVGVGAFLVAEGSVFTHVTLGPIRMGQKSAIESGASRLWVSGYVDYVDAFDTPYRAGYGRVYSPLADDPDRYSARAHFEGRNNLVFDDVPVGYNYDRER